MTTTVPATTVPATTVRAALAAGTAVVVPNPAPLTCVVTGTDPSAVNLAKGRPADQPVAVWAHDEGTLEAITAVLDVPDRAAVATLLRTERVTLLVPLRAGADAPDWLAPATRAGWTLLFGARWAPVAGVLEPFPVLYVSSANRTGGTPVATPAEAVATFPAGTPVLDDPGGDPGPTEIRRRATTTLRLHPDGRVDLHRAGAQDAAAGGPDPYLDRVRSVVHG